VPGLTLPVTQDALRTWSAVTLEARMLTVIDVSGSMRQDAGQGRTRIELARDAAVTALRLYPDSAKIGLWAFSVLLDAPADWLSLTEVGRLSNDIDGSTRRDQLLAEAQTLPSLVGGGTGLYDTTLAAFRTVRAGYDPARVNSVVLLTDGRNEDDPIGINLRTLLRTLRAEFDPARPVPIITIGMGPGADIETLRRISETTGGKAYQALDPNDIETVFLDAMIERRCRPEC
jgi:Ca-activated chloride channel homolog